MHVTDLLIDLSKRFPRSPIDAWESSYRDALGKFDHERLGIAYRETMRQWGESYPPKPAHIAAAVRIPPKVDKPDKRKPWEIEDDRRRERAKEIFETAMRECSEEFRIGEQEGWAVALRIHLINVSDKIARMNMPVADALAKVNGDERRGNIIPRAQDVWIDEIDVGIFRARLISQNRVRVGRQ